MVRIENLETPCLGNRSYVVVDSGFAVVVDPPRDIDRIEALVEATDVSRIGLVLETHRHADYVSGGLELARRHRSSYVVPAGDPDPQFPFTPARAGDVHGDGDLGIRVIATPGHTPHHVAYVIESGGRPIAVCTGGSLLHGSVGRTDLYGADCTVELAHEQWWSARRLLEELPNDVQVLPTHGFGSLCSAGTASPETSATLADEAEANPALCLAEPTFVDTLVGGYGPIPKHYARLPMVNAAGPLPFDLSPAPTVDAATLRARQAEGHWLVDVRDRRSFARAHLRGSVNVESAGPLVAYLPWILPPGAGVVLLGDADSVDSAARQLTQVGIDRPLGIAVGEPSDWVAGDPDALRSYPIGDFAGFVAAEGAGGAVALDVRSAQEWNAGHVRRALHLSLPNLAEIADPSWPRPPVSVSGSVWVYCGGGFRAGIAASLLDATGARVTLIDQPYAAAEQARLTVRDTTLPRSAGSRSWLANGVR
jgi:hydroxyacylglutathione hydrolase